MIYHKQTHTVLDTAPGVKLEVMNKLYDAADMSHPYYKYTTTPASTGRKKRALYDSDSETLVNGEMDVDDLISLKETSKKDSIDLPYHLYTFAMVEQAGNLELKTIKNPKLGYHICMYPNQIHKVLFDTTEEVKTYLNRCKSLLHDIYELLGDIIKSLKKHKHKDSKEDEAKYRFSPELVFLKAKVSRLLDIKMFTRDSSYYETLLTALQNASTYLSGFLTHVDNGILPYSDDTACILTNSTKELDCFVPKDFQWHETHLIRFILRGKMLFFPSYMKSPFNARECGFPGTPGMPGMPGSDELFRLGSDCCNALEKGLDESIDLCPSVRLFDDAKDLGIIQSRQGAIYIQSSMESEDTSSALLALTDSNSEYDLSDGDKVIVSNDNGDNLIEVITLDPDQEVSTYIDWPFISDMAINAISVLAGLGVLTAILMKCFPKVFLHPCQRCCNPQGLDDARRRRLFGKWLKKRRKNATAEDRELGKAILETSAPIEIKSRASETETIATAPAVVKISKVLTGLKDGPDKAIVENVTLGQLSELESK